MTESTTAAHPPKSEPQRVPLVVGLGASAGGIRALSEFFSRVEPGCGAAYVVILHLSPDYESKLAEILQRSTRLAVAQVTARVRIDPNHVYVVPQNRTLSIADDHIDVAEITRAEQRRAPVDLFFRALADAHGSRAAAVVLSGTGPNGSVGLRRVKEYGGLTIAQDPDEADHGDMPRNSIATGLVDYVLPVADMPSRIADYCERLRRDEQLAETDPDAVNADPEALRYVLTLLRVRTGHDFANYKPATLLRRVQRRIHLRGLPSMASYARMMREHPDEAMALMKELLISVTNFFRDPHAFDALAARVIPRLCAGDRPDEQVRVWVAGCATGEEAYSLAMLLAEHQAEAPTAVPVQIFATDLDERAIAVAREGFYTQAEVADVSDERLERFFQKGPGGFRIRRELREMLLFAHHNLIKDPPFSHLDLISCRNMLIYLNRTVQDRVIETFHFALRPGRYLFLGGSESPDGAHDLFLPLDREAHIYESRAVTTRLGLPVTDGHVAPPRPLPERPDRAGERVAPSELHQRLLEQYAPPSLVVTEEHSVVHLSERVGRYLLVPGGEPTADLMRMVRPELRADVRVALHEAARQRTRVEARNVRVTLVGEERAVTIGVRPALRDGDPPRGYFLITFQESDVEQVQRSVQLASPGSPASLQLEEEIARLKQQLQVTIEQYETQAEEAKAANEELQAMNEELRSSAEELETSREELQSVNEELTTVNQELKVKIDELGLTNNDFQNLINASDIGTIFLDRALRVKLFTPAARNVFNLLATDIGRLLSDITSHLCYDALHHDVSRVLNDLHTIEREVEARDGRWHLMRVRPYRTMDDRIDGVVVTFQDITDRHRAEGQVRESQERLRLLLDSAIDYAIFTITGDGRIDSWNTGAERTFGYGAAEVLGQSFDLLFTPEDRAACVPAQELARAAREGRSSDERFHLRKNGERFYCSGVTTRLNPDAPGGGFAKIARDLTDQQTAASALKAAHATLEQRVQERTRALQTEILERTSAQEHALTLLRKLVTSQEDERARIARDLHDQLGQQLTALRLTLERLSGRYADDEQVARASELATAIDAELGFLAWELRPAALDDFGLAAALPRYVREWSAHFGVTAEYRSSGFEAGQLTREAEVAFYRVAQEALNNVAKHAHASRVDVMLESRDGSVVLVVEDDGIGFDPASSDANRRGLGLGGMSERAGLVGATLQIEAAPGNGTSVYLRGRRS